MMFDFLAASALFAIGLYGITSKSDFLRIFFSLEMLLNAVILILSSSAHHLGLAQNIPLAYLIIVIATLEAAAGVLIFFISNKITNEVILDNYKAGTDE